MVDINFIEIAQVCSGAFREAKQRKDDFFRIKWLKHNANGGKTFAIHTKDTFWWPVTFSLRNV